MPRRKALHEWRPAVQQQIAAALYPKSAQVAEAFGPKVVNITQNSLKVWPHGKIECGFTIPGQPIGKPRQTQRDRWAKRPCVMRYREWADRARAAAGQLPDNPLSVVMVAYFEFPESYSPKKVADLAGKPHRVKPDSDNILKCVDAIFDNDSMIADVSCSKRWDDGNGPRIEVSITFSD